MVHAGAYVLVCFAPCRLKGVILNWRDAIDEARKRLEETAASMRDGSASADNATCAPLPPLPINAAPTAAPAASHELPEPLDDKTWGPEVD